MFRALMSTWPISHIKPRRERELDQRKRMSRMPRLRTSSDGGRRRGWSPRPGGVGIWTSCGRSGARCRTRQTASSNAVIQLKTPAFGTYHTWTKFPSSTAGRAQWAARFGGKSVECYPKAAAGAPRSIEIPCLLAGGPTGRSGLFHFGSAGGRIFGYVDLRGAAPSRVHGQSISRQKPEGAIICRSDPSRSAAGSSSSRRA